jgi:hypothetical protein
MAAIMAIIAITTSSWINVNALRVQVPALARRDFRFIPAMDR